MADLEMTRSLFERLYPGLLPKGGCRFVGHQEGTSGRILPVYRVPAWRSPDEDGAGLDVVARRHRSDGSYCLCRRCRADVPFHYGIGFARDPPPQR